MILQRNNSGVWLVKPVGKYPILTSVRDIERAIAVGKEYQDGKAIISEEGVYIKSLHD